MLDDEFNQVCLINQLAVCVSFTSRARWQQDAQRKQAGGGISWQFNR